MAGKKQDNEDTRDVFEKALDAESAERKRRNSFEILKHLAGGLPPF